MTSWDHMCRCSRGMHADKADEKPSLYRGLHAASSPSGPLTWRRVP